MAATTAAIISVAATAGSAGMSFAQSRNQSKLAAQASKDAADAIEAAKRKLDVNFYDKLAVPLEAYDLQRKALISAGAGAIQAGVEGESRGAGAVAGRVQMAQNEAQGGIRTDMAKEVADLNKLSAEEDSRLRDIKTQMDLEQAAGAAAAERDAYEAKNAAMLQGMQSVTSLAQMGMEMAPLYDQNFGAQKAALSQFDMSKFTPEQIKKLPKVNGAAFDPSVFTDMGNRDYRKFKRNLSPGQEQMMFFNPQYQQLYNPFDPYRNSFESNQE